MKKQPVYDHAQARKHDDLIKTVARQFAEVLVRESEAGRTSDSETGRIAREASDEYDREQSRAERASSAMGETVEANHISDATQEGSLRNLGRALGRSESFDNDDADGSELTPDEVLDRIVAAIRERRGER